MATLVNATKLLRKRLTILHKIFQTAQHNLDTKTYQGYYKKKKIRAISFQNIDEKKIQSEILTNQIQCYIRTIPLWLCEFILERHSGLTLKKIFNIVLTKGSS